jgi:hypothetical protein
MHVIILSSLQAELSPKSKRDAELYKQSPESLEDRAINFF